MTGSRWYFPVYEGLFDAKHVAAMGQSIWLYGWLLGRAHVAQKGGILDYTHIAASQDLGVSERTVRYWFDTLQECGYIIRRTRHQYHLEVEMTNWRPVEEWLNARQSERQHLAGTGTRTAMRTATRVANPCNPTISIRLLGYEYPTGSAERQSLASLADVFRDLLERLKLGGNRPALLRLIYRLCFGGAEKDLPRYSYLGKMAKLVGGAGRLAELMWKLTAKPPTGDVLAYIQAMHKRNRKQSPADTDRVVDQWVAKDG